MTEEEIINKVEEIIEYSKLSTDIGFADQTDKIEALQGLLDLYQKEKEKNKNSISKDKIKERISSIEKIYPKETMFAKGFLIIQLRLLLED